MIQRHGAEAICAALEPMMTPERIARIDAVLAARLGSLVTVVEDTYDPHNAAATIRTTEALGLQELHAIEVEHRFTIAPGITRGAHAWIDLVRWPSAAAGIAGLRARGFHVLATAPDARATIEDVDVSVPLAILFGNEHAGVTAGAIAASDGSIAVPMHGMTESFNLSVTVGIVMSRLATRRRAYLSAPGDLDEARRRALRACWMVKKIRGAAGILDRALRHG